MSLTDAQRQLATAGQLPCPGCQQPLPYFDAANSAFFACPSCATYFEQQTEDERPKTHGRFTAGAHFAAQVLPLGATGTMPDGLSYRVIGFMGRHEAKHPEYRWGEYVLFSAPDRYAQLAEFEGHWQFIRPTKEHKVSQANTREARVLADAEIYELYNKYSPRVVHAAGEFSWNIRDDEKLNVNEFIAPPLMLVQERNPSTRKSEWFRAEHIEPQDVARAFGVPAADLPHRHGVGAIQPPPGEATWRSLLTFTVVMALALVVAQFFMSSARPSRQVYSNTFVTERDTARTATAGQSAVIVTPSFEVHGPAALQFEVKVGLDNQWLELPVNLVNEQTGQSWEFTKTVEYYHGYEDGESWSEGSTEGEATLARIPTGRYHLNLYPQSETGQGLTVGLNVTENTPLQSNLLLALLLLFAYPLVLYIRRRLHEQQRWYNSDYGPQE
jgi:hypothetical protein